MRRRPWLALVVLVLLGISATMFVNAGRRSRYDDPIAFGLQLDDTPGEAPLPLELPVVHVAVVITEAPLVPLGIDSNTVLSIAPKTSPPRC